MDARTPCLIPPGRPAGLGDPLLDAYLDFVSARSRPNTVLATRFDLLVFFSVVGKPVAAVTSRDVLGFITAQRVGVDKLPSTAAAVKAADRDGTGGVSLRTVRRRLSTVSGLYAFLTARGDVATNPVPRSLPTRRERSRPTQGVPLVRAPRTLPTILSPAEVNALMGALRTHRDRAMVTAMLLGGLRRCEVLGLRLQDLRPGERRVFVVDGKGGHQRYVPIAPAFFSHLGAYLDTERPAEAGTGTDRGGTDRVFVVLKRPRRGRPLTADGLDEILDGARDRAGLKHATCHQLRHTCLTQLRAAGMPLEAVQAQAGHASIESTRIYLHLGDDWLASQYRKAAEVIDAQIFAISSTPPGPAPAPVPVFTGPAVEPAPGTAGITGGAR
ncbi:tyrosine-type recombinase/integrase [Serinicoccus sediminis]|uniref:tyrosine-type recombinase/integrase n=1 Tax=Serinicoccus sediminis TaxID=2306021 RepID=UPI001020F776|nr:tyrosine-type recombinase/integrase [Serinicoccus sediminis]